MPSCSKSSLSDIFPYTSIGQFPNKFCLHFFTEMFKCQVTACSQFNHFSFTKSHSVPDLIPKTKQQRKKFVPTEKCWEMVEHGNNQYLPQPEWIPAATTLSTLHILTPFIHTNSPFQMKILKCFQQEIN